MNLFTTFLTSGTTTTTLATIFGWITDALSTVLTNAGNVLDFVVDHPILLVGVVLGLIKFIPTFVRMMTGVVKGLSKNRG